MDDRKKYWDLLLEGWSKWSVKFWKKKSNSFEKYSSVMVNLMNKLGTFLS